MAYIIKEASFERDSGETGEIQISSPHLRHAQWIDPKHMLNWRAEFYYQSETFDLEVSDVVARRYKLGQPDEVRPKTRHGEKRCIMHEEIYVSDMYPCPICQKHAAS